MPPSRYQAWLASLPEFNPETDAGIVVIVPAIRGTTGIVSRIDGVAKTVSRLRPREANITYRVTDDGLMSTATAITTENIITAIAPGYTSSGNITMPGLQTSQVQFKVSQPLPG